MLKQALNALTYLHSRPAVLKRLGSPDIFSPCRITPSNYFRFLRGPEYTTIKGVEFVIPIDTMLGEFSQLLTFSTISDDGGYKITFGEDTTDVISSGTSAASVQDILQEWIPALEQVTVTGSELLGFTVVFHGFDEKPDLLEIEDNTLELDSEPVTTVVTNSTTPWSAPLKRGDRIIDGTSLWSVDEIIVMHDLGAQPMAYRVRAD